MSSKTLMNISTLKVALDIDHSYSAVAVEASAGISGYVLEFRHEEQSAVVLSTYQSNDVRLFKKPESLIRQARQLGFRRVLFELDM
jgi:hypothetical protein